MKSLAELYRRGELVAARRRFRQLFLRAARRWPPTGLKSMADFEKEFYEHFFLGKYLPYFEASGLCDGEYDSEEICRPESPSWSLFVPFVPNAPFSKNGYLTVKGKTKKLSSAAKRKTAQRLLATMELASL